MTITAGRHPQHGVRQRHIVGSNEIVLIRRIPVRSADRTLAQPDRSARNEACYQGISRFNHPCRRAGQWVQLGMARGEKNRITSRPHKMPMNTSFIVTSGLQSGLTPCVTLRGDRGHRSALLLSSVSSTEICRPRKRKVSIRPNRGVGGCRPTKRWPPISDIPHVIC